MQLLKKIRHFFGPKAIVLMYHRIATMLNDPWQLAVSPGNFEEQLQVLQKMGTVIPVKELVTKLHQKSIANNSICLTFDDGYSDNYLAAKPLLEKYQCPACFFIATQYPGQERQFWWDELNSIFLNYPKLPGKFSLSIKGVPVEFDLENDGLLDAHLSSQHKQWIWPALPPTRRAALYLALWEQLKPLPYNELLPVLAEIKNWASGSGVTETDGISMTHQQLKDLYGHPFIGIGMHTVSHPALSCHSRQVQHAEISGSRSYLENIFNCAVDTIAYPYGDYNEITLSVAKELQLNAAFTTAEKVVTNHTHPHQLGRFQVKDWNGEQLEKWIYKWKKDAQFL